MPVNQEGTSRWRTLEDGSRVRDAGAYLEAKEQADTQTDEESEESSATPRTHAEADAAAAERGLEFPDEVQTVAQKVEFLNSN